MAQLTITIPEDMARDFALYKGYQDQIESEDEDGKFILKPNPETELQFSNRYMIQYTRNAVRRQRAENAGKLAEKPIHDQKFAEIQ